jgi:hypothetical protein
LILLVDISSVGPGYEVIPEKGKAGELASLLFRSREWAEKYLLEGGAARDDLDKARASLKKTRVALMEIWE